LRYIQSSAQGGRGILQKQFHLSIEFADNIAKMRACNTLTQTQKWTTAILEQRVRRAASEQKPEGKVEGLVKAFESLVEALKERYGDAAQRDIEAWVEVQKSLDDMHGRNKQRHGKSRDWLNNSWDC
jgi:hypothetical protein